MSVSSEIPLGLCDQHAAFSAIAVDHDLVRHAVHMIEGQSHSLFKWHYLLATMTSDVESSAGYHQRTFSASTNFDRSNDDAALSINVMPDSASKPHACSAQRTNIPPTKTRKTTAAAPFVAISYSMSALDIPSKPAICNSVAAAISAFIIQDCAARATWLLTTDRKA